MKRIYLLLIILAGFFFTGCEDDKENPVLTELTSQEIIAPTEGDNIIITAEMLDSNLVVTWSAATYNIDVIAPTYILQLDKSDGTFEKPNRLVTTSELFGEIKYSNLNKILTKDFGVKDSVATPVKIRVQSHIANQLSQTSAVITFNLTPYFEPEIDTTPVDTIVADTVYLVGSATLADWDNTKGLPVISAKSDSVYIITTTLTAGGMKVLKKLGAWAPQWGDDGSFSGVLKYRPDEATTDPAEIPSPGEGTFKIEVDLENLTYTITPI